MIKDIISELEKSTEFTSWKKGGHKAYLVHAFKMHDKANQDIWQIGYFNPETNLITVFEVGSSINRQKDAEVFKEQEKLVHPLILSDAEIDETEAMKKANETLGENYKGVGVFKSFMILQNLDEVGQVWNVTFVTMQFKTVNVKIDAKTGDVVTHKAVSLVQEHSE